MNERHNQKGQEAIFEVAEAKFWISSSFHGFLFRIFVILSFTLLLSYVVPVKSKVKISQNFVAFSEYMNSTTWIETES